ncbi:4Fe-4S dicluster domain-containing protein [Candidatus Peregrinibacteria bacterium]|nr:4Fe-4S dicluster domain-containing protein [Candidatus Peregrinibacteria bacterium]
MGQFFTLPPRQLSIFLEKVLAKGHRVIAPQKKGLVRFEELHNAKNLYLKENSYFPLKEYFFGKHETIFEYNNAKIRIPKIKTQQKIFFGIRRCDLNAIAHQDLVFLSGKHPDPYYTARRKGSVFIGYHCNTPPSKYCFCGSLDLEDFYDIMIWRKKEYFLLHVQTKAGEKFLKPFLSLFKKKKYSLTQKDQKIPGTNLLKKKNIRKLYGSRDWEKGAAMCLSCSACTTLCPTCYCHELSDIPDLKKSGTGKRVRCWSSCQLKSFTRVAGNHIFREKRVQRFKHRIYHQLEYFKEKNGKNLCVGCGRCISGCPTRIDFISLINSMEPSKKKISQKMQKKIHKRFPVSAYTKENF